MKSGYAWPKHDAAHHRFAEELAPSYDQVENRLGTRVFQRWEDTRVVSLIAQACGESRNGAFHPIRVCDVGCGTGRFEQLLAGQFPGIEVTGVDFSLNMLVKAILKGIPPGTQYRQSQAEDLPLPDNSMDVVLLAFGVVSYTCQRWAIPEAYRVLRPGGSALFTAYNSLGVNTAVSGLPISPAMAASLDVEHRQLLVNGNGINCVAFNPNELRFLLQGLGFNDIQVSTFPILCAMLPEPVLRLMSREVAGQEVGEEAIEDVLFQLEVPLSRSPVFKDLGMYVVAEAKKPEESR